MGIDPAPFIANIFLHRYEYKYILSLISSGDVPKAKKLSNCSRYLDDLLCLNDDGIFETIYNLIYPPEMKLSKTNATNQKVDYLDLDIFIKEYNGRAYFASNLYDKRHHFPFKVINYPNLKYSNIPNSPAYGIFISQLVRLTRVCSTMEGFRVASSKLYNDLVGKGFRPDVLEGKFNSFLEKYHKEWCMYGEIPLWSSLSNNTS